MLVEALLTPQRLVSVLLSVGIFGLLLGRLSKHAKELKKDKENGCKPIRRKFQLDPLFGLDMFLTQVYALKNNRYLEWLSNLHKGMPKTFMIKYMGMNLICSIEPEILKAVYASNWKDFGVEPIRRNSKGSMPFADKGVNTTDGDDWSWSRFLIKPFFERDVYTDTDRISTFCDRFMTLLPKDGETFDIQPLIQRWFLDLTSEYIFGKSTDSMIDEKNGALLHSMVKILRGGRLRAQTYRFMWLFDWSWWLDAVDEVHSFVNPHIRAAYKEIDEREQRVKQGLPVGPERSDLLWSMANNCRDEELLRSQLCLIIVPNNDTTSIFLSNCIWYLARHAVEWQKLRKEVADIGEAPLTFELLRTMKHLNGVMNETHRLIPNNVTQIRTALTDTILPIGGGQDGQSPLHVRKGDVVTVQKTVMYRDPDVWGLDSNEFRPDRWDGLRGSWNFLPYGGGPRRCPAQMMVQTEAAYMLVRLAKTYSRLEARDPEPYTAVMRIGPSNKNGVRIALHK